MWAGNPKALREKKIRSYKAAVFDLDGTLIDSKRDIMRAFASAFDSLGKKRPSDQALMHTIGFRLEECFRPFLGDDDAICSKAASAFREYYKDHYLDMTVPFDGIDDSLRKLSQELPIGLATMKKGFYARKILSAFGWDSLFKSVSASEEGLRPKPDPEMFLKIVSDFGLRASEVLYVGDTAIDLEMAERAGAPFLFVGWGYGSLDGCGGRTPSITTPAELNGFILGHGSEGN